MDKICMGRSVILLPLKIDDFFFLSLSKVSELESIISKNGELILCGSKVCIRLAIIPPG